MKLLLKILSKLGLLSKVNLRMRNGQNFKIPVIRSIGYQHFFETEVWLTELITVLVKEKLSPGCFIDVGANIGQTLLKVKNVDPAIAYIGFEPNPHCVFYLNELCKANRFVNTRVFPVAIAAETGITDMEMFHHDLTDSSASIVAGFRRNSLTSIKVPVVNGTQLEPHLKSQAIGIIKIDVEGGELEVLQALRTLVERDRPVIICEILPAYSEKNALRIERQGELTTILTGLGYTIGKILPDGTVQGIAEIGVHGNMSEVNYFFLPNERKHELMKIIGKSYNGKNAQPAAY